jgi:prepilin-type N-terminal cleavage/methylation domain-containing protein
MKRNKKGFTLVELLAVIVVLGIIMTIAGTAVLKQKKKANIQEAMELEQTIEDLGPNIYSYEFLVGVKDFKSYCTYIGGTYEDESCKKDGVTQDDDSSNYFYKAYKNLNTGKSFKITLEELATAGYLKSSSISNPGGNDKCDGYLSITRSSNGPVFKAYIDCSNVYVTGQPDGASYNLSYKSWPNDITTEAKITSTK